MDKPSMVALGLATWRADRGQYRHEPLFGVAAFRRVMLSSPHPRCHVTFLRHGAVLEWPAGRVGLRQVFAVPGRRKGATRHCKPSDAG
jgi:hypothetical protein